MIRLLRTKSLRFWVALGMVIALAPLVLSAIGGYLLLNRGVIAPFHDVTFRQREQIIPAQQLRVMIWETVPPVDEFVEEGSLVHLHTYRNFRAQIEAGFAALLGALRGEPATRALVERARDDWTAADHNATELISVSRPAGDTAHIAILQRFHGQIAAANDKLAAVYKQIATDIDDDHNTAVLFYERSLWVASIAGAVSLLTIALGIFIIGRILSGSVDRLVDGAIRFAEGDRHHRIEVEVPPELHRVAEEFNHMIGRIHESEAALDELAHKDSLTGLSNRRAFDEAFGEIHAHVQRHGETATLLALDIDHFKRINDAFGHAAGDEVLRAIAKMMTRNVRPFDKVFRVGGEEFSVLLPRADAAKGQEIAERLRETIASTPIKFNDETIDASVSIGIAEILDSSEQSSLMEEADGALYRAKEGGRNRIVLSDHNGGRATAV